MATEIVVERKKQKADASSYQGKMGNKNYKQAQLYKGFDYEDYPESRSYRYQPARYDRNYAHRYEYGNRYYQRGEYRDYLNRDHEYSSERDHHDYYRDYHSSRSSHRDHEFNRREGDYYYNSRYKKEYRDTHYNNKKDDYHYQSRDYYSPTINPSQERRRRSNTPESHVLSSRKVSREHDPNSSINVEKNKRVSNDHSGKVESSIPITNGGQNNNLESSDKLLNEKAELSPSSEMKKKDSDSSIIQTEEQISKRVKSSGWDAKESNPTIIPNLQIQAQQMQTPITQLTAVEQAQQFILEQQQIAQNLNEHVLKCRIYVGSLPFEGLTDQDIRSCFSRFGEIININYCFEPSGKSKGYCFIDYNLPEAAENAIQSMNGFILKGRAIRVNRTHLHLSGNAQGPLLKPPAPPNIYLAGTTQLNPALAPPVVAGSRIYVGSINYELNAADIKGLFDKFGGIRFCQLLPNHETGKHKGYGFIEFFTSEAAEKAIACMEGFPIGGRTLKVRPATTTPNAAALISTIIDDSLSKEEDLTISGSQRYLVMQKLARATTSNPSKIISLKNMVTVGEVDDDLEEEVTSECSKYGKVDRVILYQIPDTFEVIVYVLFATVLAASKAVAGLDKRWFAQKIINAEFVHTLPKDIQAMLN